jgi:hypothetical protein
MTGTVVRRVHPVGIAKVNPDAFWKKKAIPVPSGFEQRAKQQVVWYL